MGVCNPFGKLFLWGVIFGGILNAWADERNCPTAITDSIPASIAGDWMGHPGAWGNLTNIRPDLTGLQPSTSAERFLIGNGGLIEDFRGVSISPSAAQFLSDIE